MHLFSVRDDSSARLQTNKMATLLLYVTFCFLISLQSLCKPQYLNCVANTVNTVVVVD